MIHDAAATLVRQRLSRKRIRMDIETARDIVEVIAYLQNELIQ
jgi:CRISPR/Cas system-associated endonuclease Cas3-HD